MVADAERFQIPIAVELLVVVVHHFGEQGFVFGVQHGHPVAPKVGSGHGEYVRCGVMQDVAQYLTQYIILLRTDVVKLIDGQ